MTPEYKVISIGTLAAHLLWNEKSPVRTGHATTTLISAGTAQILVNPALPAAALLARLSERSPIRPQQITHVFLTCFEQDHRRALSAFEHAEWLIHEPEREAAMSAYEVTRDEARQADDRELIDLVEREIELLERCRNAPDSIAPSVDLFPLPGVTPGTCGLLIALPGSTALLCGDAIPTIEHLAQGKVLPNCASISQAQESFKEAIEIADVLILGRDNIAFNPVRRL
jgi:glyoxylase-like metal-dependent hydrolase (beta-lactamase superfamily II)